MKEIYRLNKCSLKNEKFELKFKFGIVYDDNGLIKFELYLVDGFLVEFSLMEEMFETSYELQALTEDNHLLTGINIFMIHLSQIPAINTGQTKKGRRE